MAADDLVGGILDALADSWNHAASMVQRGLAGTYGADDALADGVACAGRAAQLSAASIAGAMSMLAPSTARRSPTSVSVTFPDPGKGPLHAGPFRGIGWGTRFVLPAAAVSLNVTPPPLGVAGAGGTVTLTFSWDQINDPDERARTVIYEGCLLDAFATPATDLIRIPKPAQLA